MDFKYNRSEKGVEIAEYSGNDSVLNIPSEIDDTCVISVGKKAFMGCKSLVEVYVPGTVTLIDDYAFAQCSHLRKVVLGDHHMGERKLGRKVFEGCSNIRNICITDKEDDISFLLAAAVNRLPAISLVTDPDVGSRFWIERFDLSLRSFIARDDMEGYDDTALCGEEDISYDGIGSIDGELPGESEAFVKEACKNKCFLCLLRLMHPVGLDNGMRLYLVNYIRSHSIGLNNEAAWLTIKEDLFSNPEYIRLYLDVVNPTKEKVLDMLHDATDKHALLKSVLIGYSHKAAGGGDVFESLML